MLNSIMLVSINKASQWVFADEIDNKDAALAGVLISTMIQKARQYMKPVNIQFLEGDLAAGKWN